MNLLRLNIIAVTLLVVCCQVCSAQVVPVVADTYAAAPGYEPPAESPEYSYHHASTYIEGLLRGKADLRRAQGEYNYNTALSLRHLEEARSRHLDNNLKQTETFFAKRAINREARANERGPRPTRSDIERYARMNAPRRLDSNQYQPELGQVHWPIVLRRDCFAVERALLDRLVAARTPQNSGFGSLNHRLLAEHVERMLRKLQGVVHITEPSDYANAKTFLLGLKYESGIQLARN